MSSKRESRKKLRNSNNKYSSMDLRYSKNSKIDSLQESLKSRREPFRDPPNSTKRRKRGAAVSSSTEGFKRVVTGRSKKKLGINPQLLNLNKITHSNRHFPASTAVTKLIPSASSTGRHNTFRLEKPPKPQTGMKISSSIMTPKTHNMTSNQIFSQLRESRNLRMSGGSIANLLSKQRNSSLQKPKIEAVGGEKSSKKCYSKRNGNISKRQIRAPLRMEGREKENYNPNTHTNMDVSDSRNLTKLSNASRSRSKNGKLGGTVTRSIDNWKNVVSSKYSNMAKRKIYTGLEAESTRTRRKKSLKSKSKSRSKKGKISKIEVSRS